jgi:hypothetical protein
MTSLRPSCGTFILILSLRCTWDLPLKHCKVRPPRHRAHPRSLRRRASACSPFPKVVKISTNKLKMKAIATEWLSSARS